MNSASFESDDRSSSESKNSRFEEFLLRKSLYQLQTLTQPDEKIPFSTNQNALFESCQLVGQHLGLTFQWPASQRLEGVHSFEEEIHQLCLHSQIYYRKIRLEDGWWRNLNFPFVAFYRKEVPGGAEKAVSTVQPVAMISQFSKGYQMIDPLTNEVAPVENEVARQCLSEGYIFYRPLPEKKLTLRNLWTFCISSRKKEWLIFLSLAFCGLLVSLAIPLMTSFLFDYVIPNRNVTSLIQVLLGALLLILTTLTFNYNRESLILRLVGMIDQDLDLAVWQRMMNLPVNFFRKYSLYDLYTFTSVISSIRHLFTSQVVMALLHVAFSIIFVGLMFYFASNLALIGLAILTVEAFVIITSSIFMIHYGKQLIDRQIESSNKTFEIVEAISKIRLTASHIRFFHRWEQSFSQMKRTEIKLLYLKMKLAVFNAFWSNAGLGCLYLFVIYLFSSQTSSFAFTSQPISLGSFLAFMSIFVMLTTTIHELLNTVLNAGLIAPLWDRIVEFSLAEPENFLSKADPGVLRGEISVSHVSFGYQLDMLPVIQEVSCVIEPGQCVAFVGLSGCGKSTLVRLLLGFETPQQGAIHYDHKDIKGLNLQILRSQLGVCLQSGAILDGTIYDNVSMGRHYAEKETAEALRLAGMGAFLDELPMGLHTVLTNGGLALSGGQRQMILLARAFVGKPKILILDEATSSIDSQKQAEIHHHLSEMKATRILITQRMDTLRSGVDNIFVMDKGRIAAQGTFSELLAKSEIFSQLVMRDDKSNS